MASELSNPQSFTHESVARGPIWLCALGPVVLHGCTVHTPHVKKHLEKMFSTKYHAKAI